MEAENEQLKAEIEQLKAELTDTQRRLATYTKNAKKSCQNYYEKNREQLLLKGRDYKKANPISKEKKREYNRIAYQKRIAGGQ